MDATHRTTRTGIKRNSDNLYLDEELTSLPIRVGNVTLTGTQILALNTTPQFVVAAVSGKIAVPVAWHCFYDFNTAAFITNLDVQLVDSVERNVLGTATNGISGSADKLTVGTIATVGIDSGAGIEVTIGTGDPANGNAAAALKIKVWYVLV